MSSRISRRVELVLKPLLKRVIAFFQVESQEGLKPSFRAIASNARMNVVLNLKKG